MDLADIFRQGLQDLHKDQLNKNYKKRSLLSRKESLLNARRETRNTLMFNNRKIPADISPFVTPKSNAKGKTVPPEPKRPKYEETNKRYEMLKQWKEKRSKQKAEALKRAKPIFKVCHVDRNIGLPNLENVNKKIKGKDIKAIGTPAVKSFAPANHKFQPPKNVKPLQIVKPISRNSNVSTKPQPKVEAGSSRNVESKNDVRIGQSHLKLKNTSCLAKNVSSNNINKNVTKLSNSNGNKIPKLNGSAKNEKGAQKGVQKPGTSSSVHKATSGPKYGNPVLQSKSDNVLYAKSNSSLNVDDDKNKNKVTRQMSTMNCSTQKIDKPSGSATVLRTNETSTTRQNKCSTQKIDKPSRSATLLGTNKTSKTRQNKERKVGVDNIENNDYTEIEKVVIYDDEEITWKTPVKNLLRSRLTSEQSNKITGKCVQNRDHWNVEVENSPSQQATPGSKIVKGSKKNSSTSTDVTKNSFKSKIPRLSINNTVDFDDSKIETPKDETVKTSIKKSRKSSVKSSKKNTNKKVDNVITSPSECVESKNNEENSSNDIKSQQKTPRKSVNSNEISTPGYISPFVTISRGKESARKEFTERKSTGGLLMTSPEGKDFSKSTSAQAGADYFEKILDNQISRILSICEIWNNYKRDENLTEEAIDMINVVIGQSQLLITKKFEQFRGLIFECRSSKFKNKPITCEDLHGFWDMIYQQVIDLDKRYENLNKLKNNNWQEVIPEKKVVQPRKRGRPKKTTTSSSSIRQAIKAARNKRKNEDLNKESLEQKTPEVCKNVSPIRTNSARRSLRVSLLRGQGVKRLSSPGLTMMKVTQSIKAGDGLTPSKSILKTDVTRSTKRQTKSVLFIDDVNDISRKLDFEGENKENCTTEANTHVTKEIQSNNVTPVRRSRRLSKLT